jgi:tetratricopeptide (TPR) repeat protein
LGDLDKAQESLLEGLRLGQAIGDEAGQAYILANLGLVAQDRGDPAEAIRLLMQGLKLAQAQDDMALISIFYSYLSVVHLHMQHFDLAIEQAHAALKARQQLELQLDTTFNLTTLAMAYLKRGEQEQALDYVREALVILDACGGEGPEFPQRDYFLCAQVLQAAGEQLAAQQALRQAYDLVMARAAKISDPAWYQSFLERVPINRQIVRAMQEA